MHGDLKQGRATSDDVPRPRRAQIVRWLQRAVLLVLSVFWMAVAVSELNHLSRGGPGSTGRWITVIVASAALAASFSALVRHLRGKRIFRGRKE